MDVFAHALWAGAGIMLARPHLEISPRSAAITVAMAVMPDVPHLLPIITWSIFGDGSMAVLRDYVIATAGQPPSAPPDVDSWSHNLHCVTHSAVVAGLATLLAWWWLGRLWFALLGWWSHIVIDVFTHAADYFPSPVLYPFTRAGFDGIAWNTPWFVAANYGALATIYLCFWWLRKTASAHSCPRS